ncbi:MAG: TonB-dependent siderophore receptor [Burkholderiaceae bacterium]
MRRILVCGALLHLSAPLAWAQQPSGASTTADLETVTVRGDTEFPDGPVNGYRATRSASATRTDTPLHETPQSVTVVPRDVVEDTASTRVHDVLDYVGGVGRANNFGGQGLTSYSIRGFTTSEFYRNGFPINRGYPNAPDAYTIERLEVLRGPVASLYGRGDPGGTFNIISKQPRSERGLVIGAQVNDQGMRRTTLDATGALDGEGRLNYRVNVLAEGGRTFRDGVQTERYGIAPVLSWQLSGTTRIIFEADFMRNNHPLDRGRLAGMSRSSNLWERGVDNKFHNDNNMAQLRFEHALNQNWTLGGGLQILDGTLQGNAVEANGLQADGRTLGRNFSYRKLEWTDRILQLNLTGRFDTAGIRHTLLAGVEYDDYDYRSVIHRSAAGTGAYPIDIFDPVPGQARPPLTRMSSNDKENLKTSSMFVQDQIAFTARLKVLAGVRVERFEHRYESFLPGSSGWKTTDTAVTPRVGVIYDLTDTLAVYANTARSYKPNTGSDRLGNGFDPEKGKSYEIGAKWLALGRALSVDAALYHIEKQNVLTADPIDPNFRIAAGEVRSRGLDLNVAGNVTPAWRVIGGYSYVDAEVRNDNALPTGTRLGGIPRNVLSLLNVYEFRGGPAAGLGLGMGIKYVDRRATQTSASSSKMPGYVVFDLLAFYQVNKHLRLNLDVKNALDRDYDESAFGTAYYPGAPRIIQLGLAYRF